MWTDFNNPFAVASWNELRKKLLDSLPSESKSVAAFYFAKFQCLTVQLYSIVTQFKVDTKSFVLSTQMLFLIICLCQLGQFTLLQRVFKISAISTQAITMLWVVHASCQRMRPWCVVLCWTKHLSGAISQFVTVTWRHNDIIGTLKETVKLK